MKKMRLTALVGLALVLALAVVGGSVAGSTRTTGAKADVTAALVSDIGKFNDRGFNQSQLAGLMRTKKARGEHDRAAVELGQRLHPEHELGHPPEGEPRDRGRLPARQRAGDDGEEVPGHALRDHRLLGRTTLRSPTRRASRSSRTSRA